MMDAFLNELENQRRNGPRSRNLRLTAIRSFFRYAALESRRMENSFSGSSPFPTNDSHVHWWVS
jgi:site-specific recombinase XerD